MLYDREACVRIASIDSGGQTTVWAIFECVLLREKTESDNQIVTSSLHRITLLCSYCLSPLSLLFSDREGLTGLSSYNTHLCGVNTQVQDTEQWSHCLQCCLQKRSEKVITFLFFFLKFGSSSNIKGRWEIKLKQQ